jgi:hypothetical protein
MYLFGTSFAAHAGSAPAPQLTWAFTQDEGPAMVPSRSAASRSGDLVGKDEREVLPHVKSRALNCSKGTRGWDPRGVQNVVDQAKHEIDGA